MLSHGINKLWPLDEIFVAYFLYIHSDYIFVCVEKVLLLSVFNYYKYIVFKVKNYVYIIIYGYITKVCAVYNGIALFYT